MAGDRWSVVLTALANGDWSAVDRVSSAAITLLAVRGAGLSLMVDGQLQGSAGISDPGIAAVQELQLTLGEGPGVDAWRDGTAVLEPDLSNPKSVRWPAFAKAGADAGVRAIFAFPLRLGAAAIGALMTYRDRPGDLSVDEVAFGLVLADVATYVVLGLQAGAPPDTLHVLLANEPAHWAEIHQATGIVSVQLDVPLDEAFIRLRAHAFASDSSLRGLARDVVSGHLRLDNPL